jgi:hypothetical protein
LLATLELLSADREIVHMPRFLNSFVISLLAGTAATGSISGAYAEVLASDKAASDRTSQQPTAPRSAQPEAGNVNAIIAIHPYKSGGIWVFDDPGVGLVREPFVSGADDIIERMVVELDHPEDGFTLLFSANPFPGYQTTFEWRRSEMGGNWYYSAKADMEGWLCPALFRYFGSAPSLIYAQFKSKR